MPLLTQTRWRVAGAVFIGVAAVMAWGGVVWEWVRVSRLVLLSYWSVFLSFFALSIWCALLDLRYIRLRYRIEKRELFHQTLGSKEFREQLLEALDRKERETSSENHGEP